MDFLTTPLMSDFCFPLNILQPLESVSHNFTLNNKLLHRGPSCVEYVYCLFQIHL